MQSAGCMGRGISGESCEEVTRECYGMRSEVRAGPPKEHQCHTSSYHLAGMRASAELDAQGRPSSHGDSPPWMWQEQGLPLLPHTVPPRTAPRRLESREVRLGLGTAWPRTCYRLGISGTSRTYFYLAIKSKLQRE